MKYGPEFFWAAALTHGIESTPQMEVRDLREGILQALKLMTEGQRRNFYTSKNVQEIIKNWSRGENLEEFLQREGKKESPPRMFTVVLLYPDYSTGDYGADIYVEAAEGKDGYEATTKVQQMASDANLPEDGDGGIPPEDFKPIAVIEGDMILELDATCFRGAEP